LYLTRVNKSNYIFVSLIKKARGAVGFLQFCRRLPSKILCASGLLNGRFQLQHRAKMDIYSAQFRPDCGTERTPLADVFFISAPRK